MAIPVSAGERGWDHRLVAYFDILGWKAAIEGAGDDHEKIDRLRRVITSFSLLKNTEIVKRTYDAQLSVFSDNVVVSIKYDNEILEGWLKALAFVQLGVACTGHLIRGGITVGKLHHTEDAVFGPALNAAYAIESITAKYPRIVLDSTVEELSSFSAPFCVELDRDRFLDPFTTDFVEDARKHLASEDVCAAYEEKTGLPPGSLPRSYTTTGSAVILNQIFSNISNELSKPLPEKSRNQLGWLYDRIAAELGNPSRASDFIPSW